MFFGFYVLFFYSWKHVGVMGGIVGVLWFWWIPLSLRFYDLVELMPLFYGLIFLAYAIIFALFAKLPFGIKILFFPFYFDYMTPLGFDWFKPELIVMSTLFPATKITLGIIGISLGAIRYLKYPWSFWLASYILSTVFFFAPTQKVKTEPLPFKVFLAQTYIDQELKWNEEYILSQIQANLVAIDYAKNHDYDAIVFPENAFPMYLNQEIMIDKMLKEKSQNIAIVTGALRLDDEKAYTSTYYYENGDVQIADKHILVPFAETIPLPSFLTDWINETLFDGASDYSSAHAISTLSLKGVLVRNAICYEATKETLFRDKPQYMIAISNNGWFVPSIEPTLQRFLLQWYANTYRTMIYHSVNQSSSEIIYPD